MRGEFAHAKKINVTFSIDEDIFFEFTQTVKRNNESRDVVLEEFMRFYVEENFPPPGPTNNWTTILLQKCQSKKIGWFVQNVLRKLLESGVATDQEVIEFQKASGATQVDRLHIAFGWDVRDKFGLSFPLLITTERFQYDVGNNFYITPLSIGGKRYYLCSQWVEGLHREKLEEWIRKHLQKWLDQTDEYSRNEMIRWIESL